MEADMILPIQGSTSGTLSAVVITSNEYLSNSDSIHGYRFGRRSEYSQSVTQMSEPIVPFNDLGSRFRRLAERWQRETGGFSSSKERSRNPAYLAILDFGMSAIPFILQEYQSNGGHWHMALKAITGESPVDPEMIGRADLIRNAWIDWGRRHHYTQ
jgi:hypothetical protein